MTPRASVLSLVLALLAMTACDDGGSDEPSVEAAVDAASTDGGRPDADLTDGGPMTDGEAPPPVVIDSVGGDLTYVAYTAEGGNIFSVQIDGQLRQRVSWFAAPWAEHTVGPEPRYVAALRHADALPDGRPDPDSPAEVWILDVRARRAWPISPVGCDAGHGGVGWQNDSLVMFSMNCDGEPPVAYVVPFNDESRSRAGLLPVTTQEAAVRDVFPVVNTPVFAFTVDEEACAGGRCVSKPTLWVGDYEVGLACRVTDGDADFLDTSTATDGARRLGDQAPTFTRDLGGLVFSRNVGGKSAGPGGHFDVFRTGINTRNFFDGEPECGLEGTTVNLSADLFDDNLPGADGQPVSGQERFPQSGAGRRAPQGALLFTGQTFTDAGATSVIWLVELDGTRHALTEPGTWAAYARWVIDDYMLTGER
ncbi:MAG: hypothetical protein KC620_04505 [Myxococcales bacterium]|nr:hypothetical protein [Myxococcales bacterium]